MQTTTAQFDNVAAADVRELSWQLRISFDKVYDPSVEFFTLNSSLLDGPHVLAPEGDNIVQQWDQYLYQDYSDRVISVEITREEIEPYSVVQSFADIVLNNYDNYFTPNSGSDIDAYILPQRPVRIMLGFAGNNLPQFIGLTDRMPRLEKSTRTATFHLTDFLTYLFSQKIENTVMLENVSTGEALTAIFEQLGLTDDQLNFSATSFNRIPYFFVEKDREVGTVVRELMEAEQGRLYMDEFGVITFQNRQDYATTPVVTFTDANVTTYEASSADDLINLVDITSEVLAEQNEQSIWQSVESKLVPAGGTVEIWASFLYPATSVTDPIYSSKTIGQSHFITSADINGAIPMTDIDLIDIDVFAKTAKFTFENTGTVNGYVRTIDLWGTPVKVIDTIRVEDKDQVSIDKYGEKRYTLKTQYIQKGTEAESKAAILLDDYAELGSILTLIPKGNPAYQIGDPCSVILDSYVGNYVITKIEQIMRAGGYTQKLTVKEKEVRQYFILSQSLLDGTDVLAP